MPFFGEGTFTHTGIHGGCGMVVFGYSNNAGKQHGVNLHDGVIQKEKFHTSVVLAWLGNFQ